MASIDPRQKPGSDCLSPRAEQRRQAFLTAAAEVFIEQGYDAASMSEIVKRAGGSLSTLYSQFGDKEGIFIAVMEKRLSTLTDAMNVELASHAPVLDGLTRIGEQFAMQLMQPGSIAFYRLIVTMARKHPEIANAFTERGPNRVRAALAAYLEDRQSAGEIHVDDAGAMAGLFLEMARAGLHTQSLMNDDFTPDESDIKSSVARAVRVFLHGTAV